MGNVDGLVARFDRPLRDFKGQKLCESCWNGCHYITDGVTKAKIANCFGPPCECHCIALLNEKRGRPKKDRSKQVNISELVGNDVITVGTEAHRDEN